MSTFSPRAWYKPRNEWEMLPGKIQENILSIKSLCGENATLELGQNWDAMLTRPGGKRVNVTDSIVRWEAEGGDPDAALIEFYFFHKKVEFMGYKMPLSIALEKGLDKEAAIEWLAKRQKEKEEIAFRKASSLLTETVGEITGLSVWAVKEENILSLKYYGDVRNCEFTVEGIKEAVASFNIKKRVRREFSSYSPKAKPKPKLK